MEGKCSGSLLCGIRALGERAGTKMEASKVTKTPLDATRVFFDCAFEPKID